MIQNKNKPLIALVVTIFLDMLGYGILIPVIPILLGDPSSPSYILPSWMTLQDGYVLLGILLGAQPFMQFFASPILGQLSDRYGRKRILFISILGTALSYVLFAVAILTKNIPLLFFSRILDGVTGGNISVAQAAIADISSVADRTKNYGIMGAAFGIGFIIGPFIGGQLSDPTNVFWFSASTPFWFAVILSVFNLMIIKFFLPETNECLRKGEPMKWLESAKHIYKAFTIRNLRSIFISTFFYYAGFSFFTTFFSIFLIQRLGYDQGDIGSFFAYVGIWLIFTQLFVIRVLLKDIPERFIIPLSMAMSGIGIFAIISTNTTFFLCVLIPIFAIGLGVTMVNVTSLVSKSGSKEVRGEILGINASVQALAQSIPPILSGIIAAVLTSTSPIYVSATLMLLASILFFSFYRKNRDSEDVFTK